MQVCLLPSPKSKEALHFLMNKYRGLVGQHLNMFKNLKRTVEVILAWSDVCLLCKELLTLMPFPPSSYLLF